MIPTEIDFQIDNNYYQQFYQSNKIYITDLLS